MGFMGRKSPSGGSGQSPCMDLRDKVPEKLMYFNVCTALFCSQLAVILLKWMLKFFFTEFDATDRVQTAEHKFNHSRLQS